METIHEPDLSDLLSLHKKDIFNSLNCHQIATIQSYDKKSKTCKATIVYKKTISKRNALSGKYEDVLQDYPILISCPVVNLTGGKAGLRLPIAKNDVALIFFNDKDIDNWFLGKQSNGATATKRTHHFSDGIALVGIFSKNDAEKDHGLNSAYIDEGRLVIYNGTTKISLQENGKVKIENAAMGSLMGLINELIDAVRDLTPIETLPNGSKAPCTANPVDGSKLETLRTKFQGILE